MKIYLIGMPGSGKSTVGQQLADELALPFIDLDAEIEKQEGKSVREIFSQEGEDAFRQIESTILLTFASSSESFVMATGGGAPCFYDGLRVILDSGTSIFLDVPVSELVSRVEVNKDRPLLLSADRAELEQKLMNIRNNRLRFYQQATFTVQSSKLQDVLEKINLKK